MDPIKIWFGVSTELWYGRGVEIGCKSCSKHSHQHETQCLRIAETPSLDTIVGTGGNQAGTMFHTTFDIFILVIYLGY